MKKKALVYYLSCLTVVVVGILMILEINSVFSLFDIYGSKVLLYLFSYSAALFFPLVLLSAILAFKLSSTPYGKKSVKLLTNVGIVYAIIKIILVIISSFKLLDSGVF